MVYDVNEDEVDNAETRGRGSLNTTELISHPHQNLTLGANLTYIKYLLYILLMSQKKSKS